MNIFIFESAYCKLFYFITNIEQIILYRIYDRLVFWKFLTKITVNFRKLSQNRVLFSRRSGICFSKFFKVGRTYLKSEIVQNLALKESHLLINFVKNELLHKYLLRILRLFMEAYTCHNMALILSRYSYLHWFNVFSAFASPEFEIVQWNLFLQKLHLPFYLSSISIIAGIWKGDCKSLVIV